MNPQQLVESVLYLPTITRDSVSRAIGVPLQEQVAKESPSTRFFRAPEVGGPFSLVTFQLSKDGPGWVLNCTYNLENARHPASSVAWHMYGPCIREGVIPRMGPEGCSAHEFSYSGLIITFHITVQSQLVYSVVLKRI
jgi:hypothetical protein